MNKSVKKRTWSVRKLTVCGMLCAISIVLGMTPIGYIPTPIANITTMHIPAVLAGILEGPVAGLAVGAVFGLTSLYKAVTSPTSILSAFLVNPVVSVLPRMLIGPAAWLCSRLVGKIRIKRFSGISEGLGYGISAFVGTLINTSGVLGMVYVLYAKEYADAIGSTVKAVGPALLGICMTNGMLEAAAAVLITVPIALAVKKLYYNKKKTTKSNS